MVKYFLYDYQDEMFQLFSVSHITVITIILSINILIFVFRDRIRDSMAKNVIRLSLACLLIVQELSLNAWYMASGEWTAGYSLPLHLCGASVVLSAAMLFTRSYRIYEIVFFWGVGGALQAILTPDLQYYIFPHYRFFQFFISHGSIITACFFMTFIYKYRPQHKSIWKAIVMLNIYAVFIAGFNKITDGNYLFICAKPAGQSLMDYLGPWPWYILLLEPIAVILFYLLYVPFAVVKHFETKRNIGDGSQISLFK